MSRRGENIYKRKDGRWEGRYIKEHIDGRAKYVYVYARTYRDVKEKMKSAHVTDVSQVQGRESLFSIESNRAFSDVPFEVFASRWIESNASKLKESSINKYRNILKNYLLPRFGGTTIEMISREDVTCFCSDLLNSGGQKGSGLSPKTVSDVIAVLKSVLEYSARTDNRKVADISRLPIRQFLKPFRVFSRSEQQTLFRYLVDNMDYYNLGILISLYTGIRIGELCALTWNEILLGDHMIYVHKTMQRIQNTAGSLPKTIVIISDPKSECSVRYIPIPDQLYHILCKQKKAGNRFVLTGQSAHFVEPRLMQYHFKTILKRCGIEHANFHALRHTFATRCVEMGFDIKSLSEILGHSNVNITLNRYVHPPMQLKQKNMDKLVF